MPDGVNETQWLIAWAIGGGVVLVVVAVTLTIIALARSIRGVALQILEALEEARDNTEGLWQMQATIQTGREAAESVRRIRRGMEG